MADNAKTLLTPVGHLVTLALTGVFFVGFSIFLTPWVPSSDPLYGTFFGIYTAACMTGVFFLAANMFRLVLADHNARLKARA